MEISIEVELKGALMHRLSYIFNLQSGKEKEHFMWDIETIAVIVIIKRFINNNSIWQISRCVCVQDRYTDSVRIYGFLILWHTSHYRFSTSNHSSCLRKSTIQRYEICWGNNRRNFCLPTAPQTESESHISSDDVGATPESFQLLYFRLENGLRGIPGARWSI